MWNSLVRWVGSARWPVHGRVLESGDFARMSGAVFQGTCRLDSRQISCQDGCPSVCRPVRVWFRYVSTIADPLLMPAQTVFEVLLSLSVLGNIEFVCFLRVWYRNCMVRPGCFEPMMVCGPERVPSGSGASRLLVDSPTCMRPGQSTHICIGWETASPPPPSALDPPPRLHLEPMASVGPDGLVQVRLLCPTRRGIIMELTDDTGRPGTVVWIWAEEEAIV